MSDRNRVRFTTKDSYDDDDQDEREPELQIRSPTESYRHHEAVTGNHRPLTGRKESFGSPRTPSVSTRNNVRFIQGPTVRSPQISSPVIRDPTPYHHDMPLSEEEDEDWSAEEEGAEEHIKYPTPSQSWQDNIPDVIPLDRQATMAPPRESPHRLSPNYGVAPLNLYRRRSARKDGASDEDTLNGDGDSPAKDKDYFVAHPTSPPAAHMRHNEMMRSPNVLRPVLKHTNTQDLEEGGVPHRRGMVENLMSLYGLSKRKADRDDLTLSRDGTSLPEAAQPERLRPRMQRTDSTASALGLTEPRPLDPDHPLITGVKRNTKGKGVAERIMHRHTSRGPKHVVYHVASMTERQIFILRLAKALMTFGAPSHRIESQLDATASVLEVDAQFIHLPSVIIASFGDTESQTSDAHFVKANGRLALGKLHNVHQVYRQVVHDEIGAEEGTVMLMKLLKEKPLYGLKTRCLIAFACCALICPLAFGGSFLDMWVAGTGGAILCFLQLRAADKSAMYANVFEISVSILISFAARGLSTIPGHLFCYESISSSGVVLILPGYLILCSALELASKNIVNGSVRMIYAIIYSLFLGFGLTIGSDLYYIVDPRARQLRKDEASSNYTTIYVHGSFVADNSTDIPGFNGSFSFSNATAKIDANYEVGCLRDPSWPWYQQNFPFWTLFLLVPAYSLFSSSWNLQPLKSTQLPAMIIISCAAFAANTAANRFILNRSDVVSAIGAFVVGILGNAYSRIFRGTAFQCMVIGVLFLVPSGIAAAGGLSENYTGQDGDQYTTGLAIGLRMVQVAIGITVGLFGSGLIVYSFGSKKHAALFAF